jgi:hypothetical protein
MKASLNMIKHILPWTEVKLSVLMPSETFARMQGVLAVEKP